MLLIFCLFKIYWDQVCIIFSIIFLWIFIKRRTPLKFASFVIIQPISTWNIPSIHIFPKWHDKLAGSVVCLVFSKLIYLFNHSGGKLKGDKVGGKDTNAAVGQLSLPPVVLGVRLSNDCDAVPSGEAQVSGLLACVWVGCRNNQLASSSAHWRSIPWRKTRTPINFGQTLWQLFTQRTLRQTALSIDVYKKNKWLFNTLVQNKIWIYKS